MIGPRAWDQMQDQTPLHKGGKTVRLAVVNPRCVRMYSEASKCGQAPTCTLRRTLYWERVHLLWPRGTSLSGFGQTLGGSQVYKRTLKNILPLVLFVLWLVVSAALPLVLEVHGTVRSPVYRRLGRLTIWHRPAMDGFSLSHFCE